VNVYRDGVLISTTANDGQYTDPHFHQKRKKGRKNSENNIAEHLALGHLRLLSGERLFAHNRRNEEMVFGPTSSFVFCDPVSLSNYFVRLSITQTECLPYLDNSHPLGEQPFSLVAPE
jgi:hypothetical protein